MHGVKLVDEALQLGFWIVWRFSSRNPNGRLHRNHPTLCPNRRYSSLMLLRGSKRDQSYADDNKHRHAYQFSACDQSRNACTPINGGVKQSSLVPKLVLSS